MAQLIVRDIEPEVVRKLKEIAGQHGVSMEEEHRSILRKTLLGQARTSYTFKELLASMPDVGKDTDFERQYEAEREIEL